MEQADHVWNRACAEAGKSTTLTAPGDRALADMVLLHSLAMNGGVLHAIETLNRPGVVGGFILCEEDGDDGTTEVESPRVR